MNNSEAIAGVTRTGRPAPAPPGRQGTEAPHRAVGLQRVAAWLLILVLLATSLALAPETTATVLAVAGLGLPLLWLLWARPELGLLGLLFVTSSFIKRDTIGIRLPVGGLDLRDLLLLALFALLLFQALGRRRLSLAWGWPTGALLAFLGIALGSAVYAVLYQGVDPKWTLNEFRPLVYYLVFFLAVWALRRPGQLVVLLAGLYLLADLTAGLVIFQQFFGLENRLLEAMSGGAWLMWETSDTPSAFGAVRIVPPGHVLVYFMVVLAFGLMVGTVRRPLLTLFLAGQFVYLNFSLLLTYTRAQWIASGIAFSLVLLISPATDKRRLLRYLAVVALPLLLIGLLLGPELPGLSTSSPFLEMISSRAGSMLTVSETMDTDSLRWRAFESAEAAQAIAQHPFTGVGLGNVYREVTTAFYEATNADPRFTRYVHNSYLYLAVKMGLPGLLAMLWFLAASLLYIWRTYQRAGGYMQRIALSILAATAGLLSWSVTQSHLLQVESIAVIGLTIGMVAAIGAMPATIACTETGAATEAVLLAPSPAHPGDGGGQRGATADG